MLKEIISVAIFEKMSGGKKAAVAAGVAGATGLAAPEAIGAYHDLKSREDFRKAVGVRVGRKPDPGEYEAKIGSKISRRSIKNDIENPIGKPLVKGTKFFLPGTGEAMEKEVKLLGKSIDSAEKAEAWRDSSPVRKALKAIANR